MTGPEHGPQAGPEHGPQAEPEHGPQAGPEHGPQAGPVAVAVAAPRGGVLAGRSELGVVVFLLVVAGVVLAQARSLSNAGVRGVVGPAALPTAIGLLLVGCAIGLAVDVLRGGRGEAEGGEDVDLSFRSDWRTVLALIGVFGANAVLIEPLGWVISGSMMFLGCTLALGSRHWVRDAVIAVVLALVTFYGFAVGLGVNLPAGILTGIL